jgi:hypothetical protein
MSISAESTKGKPFDDVSLAQVTDKEVGTTEDADDELLKSIGYKQVCTLNH